MEPLSWFIIVCTLAIVLSVGVATWAILSALIPPQTREVRALRSQVEELNDDVDQVHGRLNERARRENMAGARETRAGKRELVERAAELVRAAPSGDAAPSPSDPEAQRVLLRRKHLQ